MADQSKFWKWFPEAPFLFVSILGVLGLLVRVAKYDPLLIPAIALLGGLGWWMFKRLKEKGLL